MNGMSWLERSVFVDSREGKHTLVAIIMMFYVMATFLAVAIHEVVGHGLATVFLGGDFYALYLSPGSGFISFYLPDSMSNSQIAFIYMAGILSQFIIGLLVFFLALPRIKNFMMGLFTLMFTVAMLVQPAIYLFLGYYYSSGDTRYAVNLLGVEPDGFIVMGLMLTGIFILMISIAAMNFIGHYMDTEDESVRKQMMLIFWMPPLLLSGVGSLISAFFLPAQEVAYTLANAAIILMFLGIAIYLVPTFVESSKRKDYSLSRTRVLSVLAAFVLVLAAWVGGFGMTQETAHGMLLKNPPVEVEQYYSDYSIGNAELMVYANGTIRVDIILRNQLENPSPMEERIYHTFDQRPYWDKYIAKSRTMVITMFDLQREVGENITFETDFGTVRAKGVEDEMGRMCTTYLHTGQLGTRQFVATTQEDIFQPTWNDEGEDISITFKDPWHNRGGFLDEVRISWEDSLEYVSALAYNDIYTDIDFNRGNILDDTIGWKNLELENSPTDYKIVLRNVGY